MISVYLECAPAGRDQLVADLHERGTIGVIELQSGLRAWFESAEGIADLIERYDGDVNVEPEEDWVQRTEDSFPALAIGDRFWLAPPWNTDVTPDGRLRLEINPGQACGTGWHPCTQMCLEAMERVVRPGNLVLDVGTGSGILSVAAQLLGSRPIACDIDPDAARIANERIGGSVFIGSADAVRTACVDVLVANISASVIEKLFPIFEHVLRPGGRMILSGFEEIQLPNQPSEVRRRDPWICWIFP